MHEDQPSVAERGFLLTGVADMLCRRVADMLCRRVTDMLRPCLLVVVVGLLGILLHHVLVHSRLRHVGHSPRRRRRADSEESKSTICSSPKYAFHTFSKTVRILVCFLTRDSHNKGELLSSHSRSRDTTNPRTEENPKPATNRSDYHPDKMHTFTQDPRLQFLDLDSSQYED